MLLCAVCALCVALFGQNAVAADVDFIDKIKSVEQVDNNSYQISFEKTDKTLTHAVPVRLKAGDIVVVYTDGTIKPFKRSTIGEAVGWACFSIFLICMILCAISGFFPKDTV